MTEVFDAASYRLFEGAELSSPEAAIDTDSRRKVLQAIRAETHSDRKTDTLKCSFTGVVLIRHILKTLDNPWSIDV